MGREVRGGEGMVPQYSPQIDAIAVNNATFVTTFPVSVLFRNMHRKCRTFIADSYYGDEIPQQDQQHGR